MNIPSIRLIFLGVPSLCQVIRRGKFARNLSRCNRRRYIRCELHDGPFRRLERSARRRRDDLGFLCPLGGSEAAEDVERGASKHAECDIHLELNWIFLRFTNVEDFVSFYKEGGLSGGGKIVPGHVLRNRYIRCEQTGCGWQFIEDIANQDQPWSCPHTL